MRLPRMPAMTPTMATANSSIAAVSIVLDYGRVERSVRLRRLLFAWVFVADDGAGGEVDDVFGDVDHEVADAFEFAADAGDADAGGCHLWVAFDEFDALGEDAFVEAVENNTTMPISGADGRAPLVIGMAAKKSMDEGRPVQVSEIT